jgi:outer membrane protein TolC
MGPALSLVAAAPTIIQTSQDAILGVVRQNMSEQQFNNYFDGIQRNPFNQFVNNTVCGNQTANTTLGVLGYDCHHWDQFDHNIAEAEAAARAAEAAAADAANQDAFQANFDAAWNAYMNLLNQRPPILRDAQGTPLEPEGPAQVQGFPQRIPKNPGVQTKALPEDEPQRV